MFPRAKKSFGQNFLTDQSVVAGILTAADIRSGERVLEIGPGAGVLTKALLGAGANLIAVEADTDLISGLQTNLPAFFRQRGTSRLARREPVLNLPKNGGRLRLIAGDILSLRKTDPSLHGQLEEGAYKLVANIPYNITSAILEEFLSASARPFRLVLMVQREVADRIIAKPPGMSLLSVMCQLYATVKKALNVPRGAFRPSPHVDSAVIVLDLRPSVPHAEDVIRLAKAGFAARRKQLHGNLAHAGFGTSTSIKEVLTKIGMRPDARAEMLKPEDWITLWKAMK